MSSFKRGLIYKIRIIALCLLLFSLPFEYWDPFGFREVFTVTKIAAVFYFFFSLFDIKSNFSVSQIKKPLFLLFGLWVLLFIQNVFNHWPGSKVSILNLSFLQNILLFWLVANDIIRNPLLFKKISLSFVFGVLLSGLLVNFGIGLNNEIDSELGTFRLYFFGSNPNTIGLLAAIALIFLINILLNWKSYYSKKTFLLLLGVPLLISLLSFSGSRGALFTAFIGITLLFLFQKTSLTKKFFFVIAGSVFIYFAASEIFQSSIMQSRLQDSIGLESLGGRKEVWNIALDVFYYNPLFGKGVTGYEYEVIQNIGFFMDTHNLFLYFMVSGGIVALVLYLMFIYNIAKSSFLYARYYNQTILFVLLIVYMSIVVKSGGAISGKISWLLTAIIYGTGQFAIKKKV